MDSQINKKREYFPTTVAFVLIWVKRFPAMCSPVPNDLIFRGCYGFYLFFWLFCKIYVIKYFVRSELIKYSSCCRYLSPMLFNIYHICWINNNLLSGWVHFSYFPTCFPRLLYFFWFEQWKCACALTGRHVRAYVVFPEVICRPDKYGKP